MVIYPGDNIYVYKLIAFREIRLYPLPDVLESMKSHRTLPGSVKECCFKRRYAVP